MNSSYWSKTTLSVYFERTKMAPKLSALKIVESAHMLELKELKMDSRKLKTVFY